MARIPNEELERIKREVNLGELVRSRGVELKPQGKDLVGRCPLHGPDETPRSARSVFVDCWRLTRDETLLLRLQNSPRSRTPALTAMNR